MGGRLILVEMGCPENEQCSFSGQFLIRSVESEHVDRLIYPEEGLAQTLLNNVVGKSLASVTAGRRPKTE